jgi:hypothetical protein
VAVHDAGVLLVPQPPRPSYRVSIERRTGRALEPHHALRVPSPARRARGSGTLHGERAGGPALRARAARGSAAAAPLHRRGSTRQCSSRLNLIRCGWSASTPRRRWRSAS